MHLILETLSSFPQTSLCSRVQLQHIANLEIIGTGSHGYLPAIISLSIKILDNKKRKWFSLSRSTDILISQSLAFSAKFVYSTGDMGEYIKQETTDATPLSNEEYNFEDRQQKSNSYLDPNDIGEYLWNMHFVLVASLRQN